MIKAILIVSTLMTCQPAFAQTVVDEALKRYSENGRLMFDSQRGHALWHKKFPGKDGKVRQCTTCHGTELSKNGKHVKSGKLIKPMAPTVNPQRFTSLKKINKWFKRNCKWTLGRECSNQEKGDILSYLSHQ